MFVLIWRRSGIAIIIYLALSFWIVGYWYKDHTGHNAPYIGWSLFYAAIVTTLHALLLLAGRNASPEEDNTGTPAEEQAPQGSVWTHSLFYIPVLFWPLILGGASAYSLFSGDDKAQPSAEVSSPKKKEVVEEKRVVHFLNSTLDTIVYQVNSSKEGFFGEKTIGPKTYKTGEYYAGNYRIVTANTNRDILFELPSEKLAADKTKCKAFKDDEGKTASYRTIKPPTPSKNDYDELWVMLDGAHNMILVDVTSICTGPLTEKQIKAIDWTKNVVERYEGSDIIEPMYGKDPGDGTYTILTTGQDIPGYHRKNERVFALMSTKPDAEVTNQLITDKILDRVALNK